MTMSEFQALMGELSEIRASLGRAFERIQGVALSLGQCQALCAAERTRRTGWIHWTGGIIAALVPAALIFYFQKGK